MIVKSRAHCATYLLVLTSMLIATSASADDMDDVRAVIDAYIATETDLAQQAELMTDDRVYIVGGTRFTDNVANMRGQLAGEKLRRELDPDGIMIVTAEGTMVRLYGDTAIASFYRHWNWVPGAESVRAGRPGGSPPSQITTVALSKMGRDWKIVHTHISPMGGN